VSLSDPSRAADNPPALPSPSETETLAKRTRRRVSLRIIPWLFFLYILAYLDRVNVSAAQLGMQKMPDEGGLGFDSAISGFGAGIFFWGYWILEIPSTVSVVRWGARWVFVRILVLWGICACLVGTIGTPFASHLFAWLPHIPEANGFVQSVDAFLRYPALLKSAAFVNGLHDTPKFQFYFFRFMLGFFEGGFFPSVIVYLSHWFRSEDRAKAIANFMSAIPISSALGVPASGLLLGIELLGWPGWRWIFILEGIAPILAGIATLFFLPDRPQKAKWLSNEEKNWLRDELDKEHQGKLGHGHRAWIHHFGIVLLLTLVYFGLNVTSYGLSMFMPAIIKSQLHFESGQQFYLGTVAISPDIVVTMIAGLPYVMALIGMLFNGWHSDRSGERAWHVAVPLFLLSMGIWLAALLDRMPVLPAVVMIFCVGTFMYAHLPAFWPIPTIFLGATAAASAIGFINMIGNLGGSVGPMMVGEVAKDQASFAPSLLLLAPWPLLSAVIILIVGYIRRRKAAKLST
jgi:MFS transporter, ACS family, tartrate transporter